MMLRRLLAAGAAAGAAVALGPVIAGSIAADADPPKDKQGANLAHKIVKVVEKGPNRIVTVGGWHPDPSADDPEPEVEEAIKRFGTPTTAKVEEGECVVAWDEIGVTAWFAHQDEDADLCEDGVVQRIQIGPGENARGWRTNRDIYIGSATKRARAKYKSARYEGVGMYSLVRKKEKDGGTTLLLQAGTSQQVKTPRIQSFVLYPLAASFPDS